jgi:aldehyde dehydrogenase (NAD+)
MTLIKSFQKLDYSQALESDNEAHTWLKKHGNRFGQYIDGVFTSQDSADLIATHPVFRPS